MVGLLRTTRSSGRIPDGVWAKLVVDNAAGLTLSPQAGGNAPPGLAARALPVGAKLEVSREVRVSSAAAGEGEARLE